MTSSSSNPSPVSVQTASWPSTRPASCPWPFGSAIVVTVNARSDFGSPVTRNGNRIGFVACRADSARLSRQLRT
jgi:hypothetical protein